MIQRKITVKGFSMKEVVLIIIICCFVSALVVGTIMTNKYRTTQGTSYRDLLVDDNVKDFLNVYSEVTNEYYEDVDKSKVIDSAIKGMMGYLGDRYSSYLDSDASKNLNDSLSGSYKGIGISINNESKIIEVFDDSPAMKSGLIVGDVIKKINGIEINKDNTSMISKYIQEGDSTVNIEILRDNETKVFNINIESIISPSIVSKVFDVNNKKIGYIYIESFTATLGTQVEKEVNKMDDINGLIIDVRGNNGGYLKAATDVASVFLEQDKVIYYLESKNGKEVFKDKTSSKKEYPIAVLMNVGSASASEILAAALKESYGAILVGTKSYGKGLVQMTYELDDGSMAKYSSAKWLTPNGTCIEGNGLDPDYEVTISNNDGYNDSQLNKAIELLSEM